MHVPNTIDHTGSTDVTAALNNWVAAQPNGSTLLFDGGTYLLSQGIQMAGRTNLTLDGQGATLRVTAGAPGTDQLSSPIVIGHTYGGFWGSGGSGLTIRNFNLVGNDPTPGTFTPGVEGESGLEVDAVNGLEVTNVIVSAVPSDGIKVGDASQSINFHNNHVVSAGRNCVSVISGSHLTFSDGACDTIGYVTFDVEPNTSSEASSFLTFARNSAGTWAQEFFALDGSHTGADIHDVTVTGNTITGRSLKTVVDNGGTARDRTIVFTNNTSQVSASGPVLSFLHVDGLTVTGNVQPLSSGSLAAITDCTGVVYQP